MTLRGLDNRQKHDPRLIFDLTTDISERRDITAERPRVVEAIREVVNRHKQSLGASHPLNPMKMKSNYTDAEARAE